MKAVDAPAIEITKKKTIDLDLPIESTAGAQLTNKDDGRPITLRTMLRALAMDSRATPHEALRLYEIAIGIRDVGERSATLEESDVLLLRKYVDQNPSGWGAFLLAQVYRALV